MGDVRTEVELARALLGRAITDQIFPAAVAEVGDSRRVLWREAFGRLTFDANAAATLEDSIFDLASLTKPLVTATLAVELESARRLEFSELVSACFGEWRGIDRETTTVRDLLEHASGLPARLLDRPPVGRREFEHEICTMPLEYAVRAQSIYSDLGFILLGFTLEDRAKESLSAQTDAVTTRIASVVWPEDRAAFLRFGVPQGQRAQTAPTRALPEDERRSELLAGVVHDDYAAALGGVAGHAGLFGNAAGVGGFARVLLRATHGDASLPAPFAPRTVTRMTRKSTVPGSSRALGWDTMRPTSSCGAGMSPAAFGHVGYTGTSLWIDPILDRYFVLLTNRACDGGTLDQMRTVRRAFHDALVSLDS